MSYYDAQGVCISGRLEQDTQNMSDFANDLARSTEICFQAERRGIRQHLDSFSRPRTEPELVDSSVRPVR